MPILSVKLQCMALFDMALQKSKVQLAAPTTTTTTATTTTTTITSTCSPPRQCTL